MLQNIAYWLQMHMGVLSLLILMSVPSLGCQKPVIAPATKNNSITEVYVEWGPIFYTSPAAITSVTIRSNGEAFYLVPTSMIKKQIGTFIAALPIQDFQRCIHKIELSGFDKFPRPVEKFDLNEGYGIISVVRGGNRRTVLYPRPKTVPHPRQTGVQKLENAASEVFDLCDKLNWNKFNDVTERPKFAEELLKWRFHENADAARLF